MYEVLSRELEKYNVPKAPKAILAGGFSGLFYSFINKNLYATFSSFALFSGVIMWAGVIHIDVVKSRIQSDNPLNPRYVLSRKLYI